MREETEEARRPGNLLARIFPFLGSSDESTFEKTVQTFDQWRVSREEESAIDE